MLCSKYTYLVEKLHCIPSQPRCLPPSAPMHWVESTSRQFSVQILDARTLTLVLYLSYKNVTYIQQEQLVKVWGLLQSCWHLPFCVLTFHHFIIISGINWWNGWVDACRSIRAQYIWYWHLGPVHIVPQRHQPWEHNCGSSPLNGHVLPPPIRSALPP